jgi:hypothetical protein
VKAKRRWPAKLARPITWKDGTTQATLADVRSFILNEPEYIQERNSWQRAAALLREAAEHGGSIEPQRHSSSSRRSSKRGTCGDDRPRVRSRSTTRRLKRAINGQAEKAAR